MNTVYKMHYLKTHLSKLVTEVDKGQPIIFGSQGKPQYVITKYEAPKGKREGFGLLKGVAKKGIEVEPDLGGWTDEDMKELLGDDGELFS